MITADKFNRELATIMRHERKSKGISQQALGKTMGIAAQQVQKYENATNALSSYRLLQVADALNICPEHFIVRAIGSKHVVSEPELDSDSYLMVRYLKKMDKNERRALVHYLRILTMGRK